MIIPFEDYAACGRLRVRMVVLNVNSSVVALPEVISEKALQSKLPGDGSWVVILYNCDCHTFEDVIEVLQRATGCTEDVAEFLAYKVHLDGRAIVFRSNREKCERVAGIIGAVGLQVETDLA
jgi:ATP-dependent Clp protease adapter protein ClpS